MFIVESTTGKRQVIIFYQHKLSKRKKIQKLKKVNNRCIECADKEHITLHVIYDIILGFLFSLPKKQDRQT